MGAIPVPGTAFVTASLLTFLARRVQSRLFRREPPCNPIGTTPVLKEGRLGSAIIRERQGGRETMSAKG